MKNDETVNLVGEERVQKEIWRCRLVGENAKRRRKEGGRAIPPIYKVQRPMPVELQTGVDRRRSQLIYAAILCKLHEVMGIGRLGAATCRPFQFQFRNWVFFEVYHNWKRVFENRVPLDFIFESIRTWLRSVGKFVLVKKEQVCTFFLFVFYG